MVERDRSSIVLSSVVDMRSLRIALFFADSAGRKSSLRRGKLGGGGDGLRRRNFLAVSRRFPWGEPKGGGDCRALCGWSADRGLAASHRSAETSSAVAERVGSS